MTAIFEKEAVNEDDKTSNDIYHRKEQEHAKRGCNAVFCVRHRDLR